MKDCLAAICRGSSWACLKDSGTWTAAYIANCSAVTGRLQAMSQNDHHVSLCMLAHSAERTIDYIALILTLGGVPYTQNICKRLSYVEMVREIVSHGLACMLRFYK